MSAFEDFIKIELPLRQVLLKNAGDPSVSGVPAVRGTYYLDTSNNYKRYEKTGGANTDWSPVGGNQESELATLTATVSALSAAVSNTIVKTKTQLSTDASNLTATQIACFNITTTKSVKYMIHSENSNSFCAFELLVAYHDTTTHGAGVQHVAYAALGQSDLTSIETEQIGDVVSIKLKPTQTDITVYCTSVAVTESTYNDTHCN
jgi:hypothetical protein